MVHSSHCCLPTHRLPTYRLQTYRLQTYSLQKPAFKSQPPKARLQTVHSSNRRLARRRQVSSSSYHCLHSLPNGSLFPLLPSNPPPSNIPPSNLPPSNLQPSKAGLQKPASKSPPPNRSLF